MKRDGLTSSNLASVGYDEANGTLEVEFRNGGVYQYFAVPPVVYKSLMSAASKGTFFDANIKKGGYRYKRV